MYPISEVFGPTIQGEGPWAGLPTYFVRFAGCDWDCSWCDTKYAVLPKYPGWHVDHVSAATIRDRLLELGLQANDRIALSGGNPALFVDRAFCDYFGAYRLSMETQVSKALKPEVIDKLSCLVMSPKPPSSGMSDRNDSGLVIEMARSHYFAVPGNVTALKYVAFDQVDLNWIKAFEAEIGYHLPHHDIRRFISVGTPLNLGPLADVRNAVCDRLLELFDIVRNDHFFTDFVVLPQLHTLAWGQKAGV